MRANGVVAAICFACQCLATATGDGPDHEVVKREGNGGSAPSDNRFIRRADLGIAAMGNYLYLLGGSIAQHPTDDSEDIVTKPVNHTLSLPLHKKWTLSDFEYINREKGGYAQVRGHRLVADEPGNRILNWGGADDVHVAKIYVLTPDGAGKGSWTSEEVPADVKRGEYGAATACAGSMLYFGGRAKLRSDQSLRNLDGNSSIALPGLMKYSFSSKSWTNYTTDGFLEEDEVADGSPSSQGDTWQRGELVCAKIGDGDPLAVAIGGASIPAVDASDENGQFLDMGLVRFWDPKSRKWLLQKTTGQAPANRQAFCSVGAASPNGTYEIFVYGGWDENREVLDDIWVLSLPAFRWFRVDAPDTTPRFDHKCHRVGDQIISIGGNVFPEWEMKDPLPRGVGIFNLTSFEWEQEFGAGGRQYKSPNEVKAWYDDGGLDSVDWTDSTVKGYFVQASDSSESPSSGGDESDSNNTEQDSPPTDSGTADNGNDNNDNNNNNAEETKSSSSSTPTAAIAGGVVGGVIALGLISFLIWFFRRRSNRRQTAAEMEGQNTYPSGPGGKSGPPYHHDQKPLDPHHQHSPNSATMSELDGGTVHDGRYRAVEMDASTLSGIELPTERERDSQRLKGFRIRT